MTAMWCERNARQRFFGLPRTSTPSGLLNLGYLDKFIVPTEKLQVFLRNRSWKYAQICRKTAVTFFARRASGFLKTRQVIRSENFNFRFHTEPAPACKYVFSTSLALVLCSFAQRKPHRHSACLCPGKEWEWA